MDRPELSVIIPVFNEEKNVRLIVDRCVKLNKKKNIEFIFVEDTGSKDNTRAKLTQEAARHKEVIPLFTKERGYGISVYNGLKKARGEFVCWTHGDIQTPPEDTLKALRIIKASKNPEKTYVKGKRRGRPVFDVLFTIGMSAFETVFFQKLFWDINAQPNMFHRSFVKKMKNPPKDFSFDLYAYWLAKKSGCRIIRFPVNFGKRVHGVSAWNTSFSAKWGFIKRTLKFSFKLRQEI